MQINLKSLKESQKKIVDTFLWKFQIDSHRKLHEGISIKVHDGIPVRIHVGINESIIQETTGKEFLEASLKEFPKKKSDEIAQLTFLCISMKDFLKTIL